MDIVNRHKNTFDDDDQQFGSNSCPLPTPGFWMMNNTESSSRPSQQKPFIVGVTGGTASGTVNQFSFLRNTGKTTCCDLILKSLQNQRVATISLDSYYKALCQEEIDRAHNMNYNFGSLSEFTIYLLFTRPP